MMARPARLIRPVYVLVAWLGLAAAFIASPVCPVRQQGQKLALPPACPQGHRSRSSEPQMILAVPRDIRGNLAVGDVVIPVAKSPGPVTNMLEVGFRKRMAQLGLYAGVEYRVVGICLRRDVKGNSVMTVQSIEGLDQDQWDRLYVTMRPLYRLTHEFERKWPIEVAFSDLPMLLSPSMYNAATLVSTLAFSATTLTTGLVGRCFISLCYIPSHSMSPSIEAGDLLVVEGVSHHFMAPKRGEIVAFRPPPALERLAESRGEHLSGSDKFVKRVGCTGGDRVLLRSDRLLCQTPQHELVEPPVVRTTTPSLAIASALGGGRAMTAPQDLTVPDGMAYVVGDNPAVSIDSRVWGCVSRKDIVGRPFFRLFPLSRFGPIR